MRDAIVTMRQTVTETLEAAHSVFPRPPVAIELGLHEATLAALQQFEEQLGRDGQPAGAEVGVYGSARLLGEVSYVALVEAAERCVVEIARYWQGHPDVTALRANARRIATLTDVLIACDAQRQPPGLIAEPEPSAG